MKKVLFIIGIVLVIGIVIYSLGDDANTIERSANSNTLYKYELDIKQYGVGKTEDGRDVIAIMYNFTNNDEDDMSFYAGIDDSVYQNGVKLEKAYDYEKTNYETRIKSGASVDVTLVYELIDTKSDVEVVLELGGLTLWYGEEDENKKITRIIKIEEE